MELAIASANRATPIDSVRVRVAWPSLIETALAIAAIAAILPLFARFSSETAAADRRFDDAAAAVRTLPAATLPTVCASQGRLAEPMVRERLCASSSVFAWRDKGEPIAVLADASRAIVRSLRELPDIADTQRESRSRALECAVDRVTSAARATMRPGDARAAAARANALLLLAAAIDGHRATAAIASEAALPDASAPRDAGCSSLALRDALARSAALMAETREASTLHAKNQAMRALLDDAGWQWAAWMVAGLVLIKSSRTRMRPAIGVSLALLTWAAAAWAGRVPWPLAHNRMLDLGRVDAGWDAMPAPFVLALAAAALALLAMSPWLGKRALPVRQTLASRVGYPGLIVATGIGWLLLLDLSANGHPGDRYLALYHHGHLWLAMLVLCVLAFVRAPLGRAIAWLLAVIDELAGRIGRLAGPVLAPALLVMLVLAIVGTTAALLSGIRQLTSEIGRVWLIVGVAWFFFLRGGPAAERVARSGRAILSLVRYAWPLAFVALVLVGMMLATRDLGPLLIASYAAGAFLAASLAMWWHVRSGAIRVPAAIAVFAFAAWIVAITQALFHFGALDEVAARRLESLAAPLAAANDQLALVSWFRQAAPPEGFGLGAIPWCGFGSATSCGGVPAQIQSDYTFTALVGAFGWAGAWMLTIGSALWLHRLIRYHGHVTRGEPRLLRRGERVVADQQAFLSWIGVAWVVLTLCQLAVTVAGNVAVLPLTGVTFPFVSFGMTSLVVNSAFLALCININVPEASDA